MNNRRHYSLTLRLALIFALLAFALLATLGVALYRELERELIKRDDAALIYRADQLRNLLNDSNTLDLIKTKPELFKNMLGNATFEPFMVYGLVALGYFLLCYPLSLSARYLERRLHASA